MKLNITRRKIIFYLSEGAASSQNMTLRLHIPRGTLSNNLQWLRRQGALEFYGAWSLTPAGRSWLQSDPTLKRELQRNPTPAEPLPLSATP